MIPSPTSVSARSHVPVNGTPGALDGLYTARVWSSHHDLCARTNSNSRRLSLRPMTNSKRHPVRFRVRVPPGHAQAASSVLPCQAGRQLAHGDDGDEVERQSLYRWKLYRAHRALEPGYGRHNSSCGDEDHAQRISHPTARLAPRRCTAGLSWKRLPQPWSSRLRIGDSNVPKLPAPRWKDACRAHTSSRAPL